MPDYKLVIRDETDAHYVSPHDPGCPAEQRYLTVYAPDGNWAIVDRWTGKLLGPEADGRDRHYIYRSDAVRETEAVNAIGRPASAPPRRRHGW